MDNSKTQSPSSPSSALATAARPLAVIIAAFFQLLPPALGASELRAYPAPTLEQAQVWYLHARSNYFHGTLSVTSAWKFAEACFEWAEYATNDTQRANLAEEGIAAAEKAVRENRRSAAAHFFLSMNKGQLARTRTLGALPLVKDMEESFLRSIRLDARFDHAAAHRSLGMLYMDAPGWPASIGSKSKAQKHLKKAVELAPDYPTNLLALMDALLRWGDDDALRRAIADYRKLLPEAKEKYAGPLWTNSWRTWDREWTAILEQSRELLD